MDVLALVAKSLIAVMLLVAGGAKLADLSSFAAVVRLFVSFRVPRFGVRSIAYGIALAELTIGAFSLSWPAVGWLNPLVFVLACGFVAISCVGYAFHRGRSCRCFGALSKRKFDAMGILRSTVIAVVAGDAMSGVRPTLVGVDFVGSILLLLGGALAALAAFTAATALAISRKVELEV